MDIQPVQRQAVLSAPELLEVVYTLPSPVILPPGADRAGVVHLASELHMLAPSEPDVAMMEARILLPFGYELADMEAIVERQATISSQWFVTPLGEVQRYGLRPRGERDVAATLPAAETGRAQTVAVQQRRGAKIAIINIYPVQFDENRGVLSYVTVLRLKLHLKEAEIDPAALPYRADPYRPIADEVDNPEMLASYEAQSAVASPGRFCQPEDSADYVIITSGILLNDVGKAALLELLNIKAAEGLTPTIMTVEMIDRFFEGQDYAEKTRNFIREAYTNWGTDFVLLVGDWQAVPIWSWDINGDSSYLIPSDLYYQCLDGEFGANPAGALTPATDWFADVYVGRVAVHTPEALVNWVAKLKAYKSAGDAGDEPGGRQALLVGGFMGLGGQADWAKPQLEQIRLGGQYHGIQTLGLADLADLSIDALYDYDRFCPTYMGFEIRDQINANRYTVLHSIGHGSTEMAIKMEPAHIEALTNPVPFFAYIASCRGGDFTQDSAAGQMLASPNGAVGMVAYSGLAINGEDGDNSYSQLLGRYFWDSALAHPDWPVGVLTAASHERSMWLLWHAAQRSEIFGSNLLGDPAMKLALPQE